MFSFFPKRLDRLWSPSSLLHVRQLWRFPRGISGRGVKLATHLYAAPSLRISGRISPLLPYAFMLCTATSLTYFLNVSGPNERMWNCCICTLVQTSRLQLCRENFSLLVLSYIPNAIGGTVRPERWRRKCWRGMLSGYWRRERCNGTVIESMCGSYTDRIH